MSLAGRLINVFATPGEVFDAVRAMPACVANWLTPALICIAVSWVGGWLVLSQPAIQQQLSEITSKAIDQQVQKAHMSREQAEPMRQAAEKYGLIGAKINAVVLPVVVAFATTFWWALILWLVGAKGFKGDFSYMKAVEVAGVANMLLVLEAIIKPLLILGMGNLFAAPSLMLVVTNFDPQNSLHAVLNAANLITLWRLGVLAIGLRKLTGASLAKAGAWVFGIWAAYTGLLLGFGAAMQALMRAAR
jgi:hypothetical protein